MENNLNPVIDFQNNCQLIFCHSTAANLTSWSSARSHQMKNKKSSSFKFLQLFSFIQIYSQIPLGEEKSEPFNAGELVCICFNMKHILIKIPSLVLGLKTKFLNKWIKLFTMQLCWDLWKSHKFFEMPSYSHLAVCLLPVLVYGLCVQ